MPSATTLRPSLLRSIRRLGAVVVALGLLLGPLARPSFAAGPVTMEAKALLQGHARIGSWMAISVGLSNTGPAVRGELRITGGANGRTRFSVPVDLPTDSRKAFVLYAQPPSFGRTVKVELVSGSATISSADVAYLIHDGQQLVVGILAERPQGIVGELNLQPGTNGIAPAVVTLGVADLPDRLEGWGTLDRLIWQDVDSNLIGTDQLAALRGWIAGGGRLVITGGTAGIASLSALPDDLLPYRPTATVDIAPTAITSLIGELPSGAKDLPALAGELAHGNVLATSGDRVVAASMAYGAGSVTLLGFDPTTTWLAADRDIDSLWRRFLPGRSSGGPVISSDDSQIMGAVSQLAALALPPIGGLIGILVGYILLIGPINYLVLRRLDRRELAWVTMPVLIGLFAVVAYGFGTALRGNDLILNEVAIVRGSPGATEGMAQVYVGLYSPSRQTYQLEFPGGALVSPPISANFSGSGDATALDIVQGQPALVRDFGVGFSSLAAVRADSAAAVPMVTANLQYKDGKLSGTIHNASDGALEKVAVVLGNSVAIVGDLAAGAEGTVSLTPSGNQPGQPLSDRIFGQAFFGDVSGTSEDGIRQRVRHAVIDQLTFDPMFGNMGTLDAHGPVVLAWGRNPILDVQVAGQTARHNANALYYFPVSLAVTGQATFTSDLIHSNVVSSDAAFFNKDPFSVNMGAGSASIVYQPIDFQGTLTANQVQFSLNGAPVPITGAAPIHPLASIPVTCTDANTSTPPGCVARRLDGVPEMELFDRITATFVRLPHVAMGATYELEQPERYVDPATGALLFRFVNESADQGVGFQFQVAISGVIK